MSATLEQQTPAAALREIAGELAKARADSWLLAVSTEILRVAERIQPKFSIMRQPGDAARDRARRRTGWASAYPKRMATIAADTEPDALLVFGVNEQFRSSHVKSCVLQWKGDGHVRWKDDDGVRPARSRRWSDRRRWRLLVTISNGRSEHQAIYEAWHKED